MFLRVTMLKVSAEVRRREERISVGSTHHDAVKSSFEMPELAILGLTFKPFRNNLLGGLNS